MKVYEVMNIRTGEIIAYFNSCGLAKEYLEFYPNMMYEEKNICLICGDENNADK